MRKQTHAKKLPIKQYTDEYNYSISHTFVCNKNNINSFTLKPKTFHRPWSLRHFKSHLPSLDFCHVMCCNWCNQSKREDVKTKITRQMITGVNLFVRSFSCSILHYNGYSLGSEPNTSDFSLMCRNSFGLSRLRDRCVTMKNAPSPFSLKLA